MKSEKSAILKLTDDKSKVSAHYFIKKNGEIILMVPDLHIAWHAGKSKWKNYNFLNKHSIGIEISNKGHENGYQAFSKKQIYSLTRLSKILIKKYKIKKPIYLDTQTLHTIEKKILVKNFHGNYYQKRKLVFGTI